MTLPDVKHPIWIFAVLIVLLIALGLVNVFNYNNSFDPVKDTRQMAIVSAIVAVVQVLINRIAPSQSKS